MIVNFCSAKATLHKKFWGTMQVEQRGLLEGVIFLTREKKSIFAHFLKFCQLKKWFYKYREESWTQLDVWYWKKGCQKLWRVLDTSAVAVCVQNDPWKKAKIIFVPCSTSCRIVQLFQTQVCFNIPHTKNNLFHWKGLKNVAIFWSNGKVNESIS